MLFRPVHPDPNHDPVHDPKDQAEDAMLYRDILQELMHIGTDLARLLHGHAVARAGAAAQGLAPATPPGDHAAAFDRIARAVRRTIALARSLAEPVAPAPDHAARPRTARTPGLHGAGQDAAGHPADSPAAERVDAPGSAGAANADRRDRPEAPGRDTPDRDAPDEDEDITGLPVAAVVAGIRRDLGLDAPTGAQPWQPGAPAGRTPADTELLCTRAAAPSGAAASGTCRPGPRPQGSWLQAPWPQAPDHDAAQPSPGPAGNCEPDDPAGPAAAPCAQPGPAHPGTTPPDSQAGAAFVLRHAARVQDARWRPPPEGEPTPSHPAHR